MGEVVPGHGGFELEAAGFAGPALFVWKRGAGGHLEDGVDGGFGEEVAGHGASAGGGDFEQAGVFGVTPDGEEAADDDAAVEEVEGGGGVVFEGELFDVAAPGGFGEEAGGEEGGVEVALFACFLIEDGIAGGGVAGDLVGDGFVTAEVREAVTGYTTVWVLDAGGEKPVTGGGEDLGRGS